MADEKNPPAEETSPSPDTPNPSEDDPHFVPADHPDFDPPPDEPSMEADGPTSRGLREFGTPPTVVEE